MSNQRSKSNGEYEIPVYKIKKEIDLIKNGIFNKRTIIKFSADKVIRVLTLQLKGWRDFYKENFTSAYKSLKTKSVYNEQLKKYYEKIFYSNQKIKKSLKASDFSVMDSKFYLF